MQLETATIRRLRDALLQSGQRERKVVSSAYQTLTRQGLLSEEEFAAIARVDVMGEAMFLVMAADGKLTSNERDAIRGAIRGLTADLLQDGTIDVMLENYEAQAQTQGVAARLECLGAALAGNSNDAEGAFALAAAVALADDEVVDAERGLIAELATRFGISSERARQILDQLAEDKG